MKKKVIKIVKKITITENEKGLIVFKNQGFNDTQLIGMFRVYESELIQRALKNNSKP